MHARTHALSLARADTLLHTGFSDRVRKELQLLHKEPEYINVVADSQRKNAAWIGASMFASLPTFSLIKVTKKEYAADPEVIFKKRV
jgi:actin-related protein